MIGPELRGRAYKVQAATGRDHKWAWENSVSLTVLEWSKLRSPHGFAGRFPVDGGYIALKARYVEEGDSGAIALANGVFIPDALSTSALEYEAALFASIPRVDGTHSFGQLSFEFPMAKPPTQDVSGLEGLGLAWENRHVVVQRDDQEDLLPHVFRVLESVAPSVQRQRIKGWSTTEKLVTREEFRPLASCNLLVTGPEESRVPGRFLRGRIDADGQFSGQRVEDPPTYALWRELVAGAKNLGEFSQDTLDENWDPELTGAPLSEVAWKFIEAISKQRASFLEIVQVIAMIAKAKSEKLGAQVLQRYVSTIAQIQPSAVPILLSNVRVGLADHPGCLEAVRHFLLWSGTPDWLSELKVNEFFDLIRLLDAEASNIELNTPQAKDAIDRIEVLEDCFRKIDEDVKGVTEMAILARVRRDLGGNRSANAAALSSGGEVKQAWRRRQFLSRMV
ncbi:MAG: hypothetical protein AAF249_03010 [Pseudomonadota bacterium]